MGKLDLRGRLSHCGRCGEHKLRNSSTTWYPLEVFFPSVPGIWTGGAGMESASPFGVAGFGGATAYSKSGHPS
eukprot:994331-Amphidinium_carterae.2